MREKQGEQVSGGLTERSAEDRELAWKKNGFNGLAGKHGCDTLENCGSVSSHGGEGCLKEASKNLQPNINL